jgi:hypothetical protein
MDFSAQLMSDPKVATAMYRERPEQFEKMLEAYMSVRPELGAAALENTVAVLAEEVAAAVARGDEAAITRAANRLGRMVGIACDALAKAEASRDEIVKLGQMILGKVAGYIEDKIPGSGYAKDVAKAILAKAQSFGEDAIDKKWGKGRVIEEFRDRLLDLAATTYRNATDPTGAARRDRESAAYEKWYSGYERFEEQVTEGFNTTRDDDEDHVERLPR